MPLKTLAPAVFGLVLAALPAVAEITVEDGYARASNRMAGAAFMVIRNDGEADRLVDVRSDAAERVELHTHAESGDGVMKMRHVEDGFAIPAQGSHALERGGDHVMFMGLTAPFEQGDTIPVTLVFEEAGEIEVELPVDLER